MRFSYSLVYTHIHTENKLISAGDSQLLFIEKFEVLYKGNYRKSFVKKKSLILTKECAVYRKPQRKQNDEWHKKT